MMRADAAIHISAHVFARAVIYRVMFFEAASEFLRGSALVSVLGSCAMDLRLNCNTNTIEGYFSILKRGIMACTITSVSSA